MIIIDAVAGAVQELFAIINKFVPDKDLAAKIQAELTTKSLEIQSQLQQGQIDINKVEAGSSNLFVAGWRPAIGWTCALALFWQFVGYDTTIFFLTLFDKVIVVPKLVAQENLFDLVLAMLGLAGYRTFEKTKKVA